jgi:Protein of unknown function (DUF2786)
MTSPAERVRKLVALAASSNENESRNAAVLACSLIREHKLSIGEADGAESVPDGWINDCGFARPRTNGDRIAESIGTTKAAIHEEGRAFDALRGPVFGSKYATICVLCGEPIAARSNVCAHGEHVVHDGCRVKAVGAVRPLWAAYWAEFSRREKAERDYKQVAQRRTKCDRCGEWIKKGSDVSIYGKRPTHYECRNLPYPPHVPRGAKPSAPTDTTGESVAP